MKNLRLAIISATGTARKRTIPAIRQRNLCSIVAVHGRDQQKVAALAKENSIARYFVDAETMLDETKPDFVFIASPPFLHGEHIRTCAERSIPVLCEKPLCLSTREAAAVQSLLEANPIPFRLAHHLRHQPGIAELRDAVSSHRFGKIRHVAMQWGYWLNENSNSGAWKLNPATGGAHAFYDAGVHAIDLIIHLLPPAKAITAIGQKGRFEAVVDEVSVVALCGETTVTLGASQSIKCPLNSLTLDFEDATIYIPHALSEKPFGKMEIVSPTGTTFREFDSDNLYAAEIGDFIGLLEGKPSRGTTLDEACRAVQILEAITESCSSGRIVPLS